MESSKNPEPGQPRLPDRPRRHRFTLDALSSVLTESLELTPDMHLFVAYSGGMDSHVLLDAVAGLRERAPWRVAAFHIDHGLQPASAQWSRHCAAICAALGLSYQTEAVAVQEIAERGLEDAARRARYAALRRMLPEAAVLLTAHHQDDQAETLLLQLLRGAGVPGLAAMPAIASFGRGRIARPLLGFTRAALADYAKARGLRWVEDASNRDTGPARNFLRHRVAPILAERWPEVSERLALAARHQAEAAKLLDELGRSDMLAHGDPEGGLRISAFRLLSPERRINLLRCWIRAHGARVPSEPVLRQILARANHAPATRHAAIRWPDAEVRRYRDRLTLLREAAAVPAGWEAAWAPHEVLRIPDTQWRLRAAPVVGAGIARALIEGQTLHVRARRGGERCLLRGHHRKVKKLFQEAGIPPWERGHWPLVYRDGDLVAIGDRWICDAYRARAQEEGLVLVIER